jgi:hypothetical protein
MDGSSKFMQILQKSPVLLVLVFLGLCANASNFEGSITFVKKSYYDTTYLHYYIKNERIRIDQYNRKGGQLIETLMVDLREKSLIAVNPGKKLYRPLSIRPDEHPADKDFEVIKTRNFRMINGRKCYQWRVRNRRLNSEIAYWVTHMDYRFFDDLLMLLRRTERAYRFFVQIPGNDGYFPMLMVERTLLRDERERVVVDKINRERLNDSLFQIPDDYTELMFSQQILY